MRSHGGEGTGVGEGAIANTLPKGPLLLSLSSGLKSRFNEYRVKLNGKSIMAIKAGASSPAREVWQRGATAWIHPRSLQFVDALAARTEISQQLLDGASGNVAPPPPPQRTKGVT